MRFESSVKNTIASIVMQLVTMMIGLILPRFYLTAYGSEINGLVSSIIQFISYFTLVEAGLASAATASLYIPLSQKDTSKVNHILAAARNFYYKIGFIFSGLVIGLAVTYPLFVKTKSLSPFDIGLLVLILGFSGAFDFFTLSKYRVLLTADQKYYIVANASTIANIVNFLLVFVSIQLSFGIIFVRAVALTSFILRSLILNIYVRHHYKFVSYSVVPDNSALNKRWDAMVLQLLGLAQTAMPVIMLTLFASDLKVVSIYSIYNMAASSILAVLSSLTNGFAASFGDMLARKESETIKKAYSQYEVLFFSLMTCSYSCMNILYISFIRLYTSGITDINYVNPLIAILFVINGIAFNIKTPAGTLIGAAGIFKETKAATILQTAIAIIAAAILTPLWGIQGVLVALIISNLYRDIDLIIYMAKHVTGIPCMKTFYRIFRYLLLFVIINLPFYFIKLTPSGFLMWLVQGVVVLICCAVFVGLFNFVFEREVFLSILIRVRYFGNILKGRKKD